MTGITDEMGVRFSIKQLTEFLTTLGVSDITDTNRDVLMCYREDLAWRLTYKGTPLSVPSQLSVLRHMVFLPLPGGGGDDPSTNIPGRGNQDGYPRTSWTQPR